MAEFSPNPIAIEMVVRNAAHAIGSMETLQTFDVVIGLAELIGRTIAAQPISPIAMVDFAQVALDHIENTIRAGVAASGRHMEDVH